MERGWELTKIIFYFIIVGKYLNYFCQLNHPIKLIIKTENNTEV